MRIQKPIKGEVRNANKGYLNPKLEKAIERDAIRFKCSRSWVIATALAAFYDVDILTFHDETKLKKFRRRA